MKRSLRFIAVILAVMMIIPASVITAFHNYVEQNPDIDMPLAVPVIDGEIEDNGSWSEAAMLESATVGYFWSTNPMTTNGTLYFAYDEDNLYFAADINDSNSTNNFVYSTAYDNIDNSGSSHPYGFNGDIVTLMLDPLGVFEKQAYSHTAWYNVGLFAGDQIRVYRSNANEGEITSSVSCAGKRTNVGWRFEIAIPWSTVISDAKTIFPGANVDKARISQLNAFTRASVMYMDRYVSGGRVSTWGRFMTVCEETYDGYSGTATSGYSPKSFGLMLRCAGVPEHIWGEWEIITPGSCTEGAVMRRVCRDCGIEQTKTGTPLGHFFSGWTITKEATSEEDGTKYHTCTVCGTVENYRIPAFGENKPLVVAYFNASQRYVSEFTHIDVLNYHPATVEKMNGNENAITHNYTRNLASVRAAARAQNPDIKFLFTVANNNLSTFESWLGRNENAEGLAQQMLDIVEENDFDGIDIDYEFPRDHMRRSQVFVHFIATLREGLDAFSAQNGKQYILSIAVPATTWAFSLFDMPALAEYVDYFNMMNYDMFINSAYTHHHASPYDNALNGIVGGSAASDIALYIKNGIPTSKIVVGCGMYAHTWTAVTGGENGLYGKGTLSGSNYHYTDLLDSYVNKGGFVRYWDDDAKAPYLFNKKTKVFISYDDDESVGYKCDLVNEYDVRGLMIFDYCTCDGIGFFDRVYDRLTTKIAHDHVFEEVEVREPVCTDIGWTIRECTVCGERFREVKTQLNHFQVNDKGYEPTCTEPGLTDGKHCRRCGEILVEMKEIAPLGHDYGEWEQYNATSERRYCSRCGGYESHQYERNLGYADLSRDYSELYWVDDAIDVFVSEERPYIVLIDTCQLNGDIPIKSGQRLILNRGAVCIAELLEVEPGAKVCMALGSQWNGREPGHIYEFDGTDWVIADGVDLRIQGATILAADDPLSLDKQSLKFGVYLYESDITDDIVEYGVIYIPDAATELSPSEITPDTPLAAIASYKNAPVFAGSDHTVITASLNNIPQKRYSAQIFARAYYTLMIGDTPVTFCSNEGVSRSVEDVFLRISENS
ncbi:MAG: hypothetical protein IJT91_01485 [Clostridia bacterium]|nr:hypothetical protein [Clostridia bacterium]